MATNKKFRKTFNVNLIKKNLSYSTQEIADLFNIDSRTVQNWYKEGLPRIDENKPFLVFGNDLCDFLKERQKKRKTGCKFSEFYCFGCRTNVAVKNNNIEIKALSPKKLLGSGFCFTCKKKVNKIFSATKYKKIEESFSIDERQLLFPLTTTIITVF